VDHFLFFQVVLFVVVFVIFLAVYACVGRLARLLHERHPDRFEELGLGDLRDWGNHSGTALVLPGSVLSFLWRRTFYRLRDDEIVRLSHAMRWMLFAFASAFAVLWGSVLYEEFGPWKRSDDAAPAVASWDARRDRAYELHHAKRYVEAIAIYDELLGSVGADAELVLWRGVARWRLGRDDEALGDFRRVMDLAPGNIEAYRNSDRILSARRRFDDCVDLWSRYLRVVPGDAEAHYQRGGAHFRRGDIAAAHADATRACELGKGEACPLVERMKALMSAGAAPQR
jgi:tetratricopeptide (TPR) repeat protein